MKAEYRVALDSFPKRVPVFPLAEVVLFPGAVLPLHIFEPRYRRMLDDAMSGDNLIAMALLKQCDRKEYEKKPPFHETICVGRVVHHEDLPDGRSNIALLGLSAGHALSPGDDKPYRTAEVELLPDQFDPDDEYDTKLLRAFERAVPGSDEIAGLREQLMEYLSADYLPAGLLNTCALTAPLFPMDKLDLLEERSLRARLDKLLELLERPWQWN